MNIDYELEKIEQLRNEDHERFRLAKQRAWRLYNYSFFGWSVLIMLVMEGWSHLVTETKAIIIIRGVIQIATQVLGYVKITKKRVTTIKAIEDEELKLDQAAVRAYARMSDRRIDLPLKPL